MRILIFVGLLVIGIISGISVYLAPNDLRGCDDVPTSGSCAPADAIVAISGGDTEARTLEAVSLYQQGWADTLIFSGAAEDKTGPSNAAAMRATARSAGVPSSAILIEEYSETTKQNAEKTHDIFQTNGIQSVILVTSAYHQRRARLEFNNRAKGELMILNHPVPNDRQWSGVW
ncbi:hypothetical protein B7Z17_04790, partial [Candidatus Saccharibacteria bacterium 32-49-10]